MSRIRLIIFDFDGTLVDSNGVKKACMRKAVADIQNGEAALTKALALGGDRYRLFVNVVRELSPEAETEGIVSRARTLIARYSECCERGIVAAKERRGARAALLGLRRRGLRLWLVSATPADHLPVLLRRRRLMGYFDGVLGGPASKYANLRKVLARERALASEALMVGDSEDDLMGARAAGIRFVGVDAERRLINRSHFAMPDLTRLVPLIDRLRWRAGRQRRVPKAAQR